MIATATELIDQSIQTTRIISNNILPVELSEKGLIASIRSFCNKIRQSQQMDFDITDGSGGISLEPSTEIILYRVIQELINNTIKHAHAKKISINFEKTTTGFKIDYRDDGVGFDHQETFRQSGSGMGLSNMQDRIDSLGGQIEFSHNEPNGTRVFVILDL
jgi:signal transduction histidine kinase